MSRELTSRLLLGPLFAATAIGLVLADIWLPGHGGALLLSTLVVMLASWELVRLLRPIAPGGQFLPVCVSSLLLLLSVWPGPPALVAERQLDLPMLIVGLSLAWISLQQMARHGLDHFVENVAVSVFGVVYIGVAAYLLMTLATTQTEANPWRGPQLVLLIITACKMGDTSAYFGGRAFGTTKLCPSISPGKTRAGFISSLVGSIVGVYLLHAIFTWSMDQGPLLAWWHGVIWGLVVGPLGALGDLLESCLKRSVQAKDSSNALPGFGGFLDVFDAVLLAAPIGCLLTLFI